MQGMLESDGSALSDAVLKHIGQVGPKTCLKLGEKRVLCRRSPAFLPID